MSAHSPTVAQPVYDPALPAKRSASYLGIHYKTLLGEIRRGNLPCIRSRGGRLSCRLSDLNTYLDNRRVGSSKSAASEDINWDL